MNQTLVIIQSIVSVLLVVFIIMQQRGTALGSAFGGGGEVYSTRRGLQTNLLWATVILVIAFIGLAIANLLY
ncbi:MAG: preprotein translocase subunit SecG [Candidatus Paceibacterota bacterium]